MTPTMMAICVVGIIAIAVLLAASFLPAPPASPPPWITREEVEQILLERTAFAAGSDQLITEADLRVLRARCVSEERVGDLLTAAMRVGDDTYVARKEFKALAGDYVRESLEPGGELHSRVLHAVSAATIVSPATPVPVTRDPIAALAPKVEKANERLRQAARKHARPSKKRKR